MPLNQSDNARERALLDKGFHAGRYARQKLGLHARLAGIGGRRSGVDDRKADQKDGQETQGGAASHQISPPGLQTGIIPTKNFQPRGAETPRKARKRRPIGWRGELTDVAAEN